MLWHKFLAINRETRADYRCREAVVTARIISSELEMSNGGLNVHVGD